MNLSPGTRLAHFEIIGSLGAGGMGEVYRARDSKLSRDVALKLLPPGLQSDPDRRARFAREARTLAALNDPHIAQVHGFEESGDTSMLVMELVDGEDLSQRIRRGPIPYDEAIAIAKQIGQALEAAHEQGIIHRDLKPANIKLRDDGTVKVLDFGLAKALESGSAGPNAPPELANSPTITSPAGVTLGGVILGTAAYMAPEQAKGKAVDKRADIWAFGCVLYEMLTGRRPFDGDDVSETLASVLKSDVAWIGVPPRAQRLLKKCLERDPKRRLHDIGDAWDLLDETTSISPAASGARWLPWSIAAVFLISTLALAWLFLTRPEPSPQSARFQLGPPEKHSFEIYMNLSPDGRRLAFTVADVDRNISLWVRDLDSLEARRLPGTAGAGSPFWSPDGRYVAFATGMTLNKIDVNAGAPQKIADAPTPVGSAAWNTDGTIVFGTRGVGPLYRVSASGGTPVALTQIDESRGERGHSFPTFLPDGKRFLYVRLTGNPGTMGIYVGSLDQSPDQQDSTVLVPAVVGPIAIAPSPAGDRLLFARDGILLAQPFDPRQVRLSGDAQPIAERLGSAGSFNYFTVAGDVLVFRTGRATPTNLEQLTWLNRAGETVAKLGDPLLLAQGTNVIAIAPDGRQAALVMAQTIVPDVWLVEFARGIMTRFTLTETGESFPAWSPDSRRVAFRSDRRGNDILLKQADGATEETPATSEQLTPGFPTDWSSDGRFLIFNSITADILVFSLDRKTAEPLLQTPFAESDGQLSADTRWLAYASNESGQNEIYVRPFTVAQDGKAALGAKWRVSSNGGTVPRWRGDGKELFYRASNGDFMAAEVAVTGNTIETALPKLLFKVIPGVHGWDVAADGQRFLISIPMFAEAFTSPDPFTVVLNWKTALVGQPQ
jgi:serine/threonine protein kinase/Tol biopolymer transport system component